MKGKAKMAKKKMMRGGSATKKMQMGGTMANTGMMNKPVNPLNNTRMRGGGVAKKKMMRGGSVKKK